MTAVGKQNLVFVLFLETRYEIGDCRLFVPSRNHLNLSANNMPGYRKFYKNNNK